MYDATPGTHGEPGAVVTIVPELPSGHGPVYFDLVTYDTIFPNPDFTETTDNGRVSLSTCLPVATRFTRTKPPTVFLDVDITCGAGVLVNASSSWGL